MKLLISIEYRTRWGEQLVMRIGKRRIALQYADGGVWTGAIERYTQSEDTEYRYEIERDGACIRSEWRPHTLRLPAREGVRTLRIREGDPLLKTLYPWERFCAAIQEVGRKVT